MSAMKLVAACPVVMDMSQKIACVNKGRIVEWFVIYSKVS